MTGYVSQFAYNMLKYGMCQQKDIIKTMDANLIQN